MKVELRKDLDFMDKVWFQVTVHERSVEVDRHPESGQPGESVPIAIFQKRRAVEMGHLPGGGLITEPDSFFAEEVASETAWVRDRDLNHNSPSYRGAFYDATCVDMSIFVVPVHCHPSFLRAGFESR